MRHALGQPAEFGVGDGRRWCWSATTVVAFGADGAAVRSGAAVRPADGRAAWTSAVRRGPSSARGRLPRRSLSVPVTSSTSCSSRERSGSLSGPPAGTVVSTTICRARRSRPRSWSQSISPSSVGHLPSPRAGVVSPLIDAVPDRRSRHRSARRWIGRPSGECCPASRRSSSPRPSLHAVPTASGAGRERREADRPARRRDPRPPPTSSGTNGRASDLVAA